MQFDFYLYGNDYTITVLEQINDFEQNKREYMLIEEHESYIRGKGYNYNDTTFIRWKLLRDRCHDEK